MEWTESRSISPGRLSSIKREKGQMAQQKKCCVYKQTKMRVLVEIRHIIIPFLENSDIFHVILNRFFNYVLLISLLECSTSHKTNF